MKPRQSSVIFEIKAHKSANRPKAHSKYLTCVNSTIDKEHWNRRDYPEEKPALKRKHSPMATILPFLKRDIVFGPDETQILSTAFDQACRALRLSEKAAREREAVAIRIIELARRGERDPAKLSAHVVRDAGAA